MEAELYGPLTCMYGPRHMKCLYVLYASYGLTHTLYGIGIVCSPQMYTSHVKCCPVLYDSYGPTIPYME